jgi:hypothetical protein
MQAGPCSHKDIREFDSTLCCLSCGVVRHYIPAKASEFPYAEIHGHAIELDPRVYTYDSLDRSKDEIRLLILHAGRSEDPIHCHIITCALSSVPKYAAVSYTWATEYGDARASQTVHIDSRASLDGHKIFRVTKTCESSLKQLRREMENRTVWIDSICINQTSVQERNHQVGLMGRIYETAASVDICIDDPAEEYSGAMELLSPWSRGIAYEPPYQISHTDISKPRSEGRPKLLVRREGRIEVLKWRMKGRIEVFKYDLKTLSTDEFQRVSHIKQLEALLNRRYFSRAWVIQEVLSARIALLHVNGHVVRLEGKTLKFLHDLCTKHSFEIPRLSLWTQAWQRKTDMISCLGISMNSSSSDPRDKVFSILSLVDSRVRAMISVSYRSSQQQVFADAVVACIAECRDLTILEYCALSTTSAPKLSQYIDVVNPNNCAPPADIDILTTPTFTMDSFKRFLTHKSLPKGPKSPRSNLRKPWLRTIFVPGEVSTVVFGKQRRTNLQRRLACRLTSNSHVEALMSSAVRRLPDPLPAHQIIPRLSVRAHLIDICRGENGRTLSEFPSSAEIFTSRLLRAPSWYWLVNIFRKPVADPTQITYHRLDMEAFSRDMRRIRKSSTAGEQVFFPTYYSAGLSDCKFLAGDAVFAIDGVQHPMLLRQVCPGVYRIVGKCYVWAAMNLDYWNPGTYKGIWSDRPFDLGTQQTQFIDIY